MSSPRGCVQCGCDDDLTAQITQVRSRIPARRADPPRGLRGLWGRVLDIRQCWSCLPVIPRLRSWPDAGGETAVIRAQKAYPRACCLRLAADIMPPPLLARVVVPGTDSASLVLPRLCAQLQVLHGQRSQIGDKIEQRPAAHPRCPIPTA